ncbi:hypothetical protein AB1L88_24500 [Tautonia sp. JC769]|uniref:hypothetical protein n=1 Tax=Tautonia sp. JC769 TaxID=3232135 RepID=UPI0034598091
MSRIRNPRYAPEFLERRLSPSSFGLMPAAQVATFSNVTVAASKTVDPPLPTDSNGDPIPELPTDDGPGLPAPI